jgi:hypothetical protein
MTTPDPARASEPLPPPGDVVFQVIVGRYPRKTRMRHQYSRSPRPSRSNRPAAAARQTRARPVAQHDANPRPSNRAGSPATPSRAGGGSGEAGPTAEGRQGHRTPRRGTHPETQRRRRVARALARRGREDAPSAGHLELASATEPPIPRWPIEVPTSRKLFAAEQAVRKARANKCPVSRLKDLGGSKDCQRSHLLCGVGDRSIDGQRDGSAGRW